MLDISIIRGFVQYLEEKNKTIVDETKKFDTNSKYAISNYIEEFQKYLEENHEEEYVELDFDDFDISDLKNIDFKDNKFIANADESNEDSTMQSSSLENGSSENTSSAEIFADILNNLLQDDNFLNTIDINLDGEISDDEYNNLIQEIAKEGEVINAESLLQFAVNSIDSAQTIEEFFSNQDYIDIFDLDGDSVLSEEEINETKMFLSSLTGSTNGLRSEDIDLFKQIFSADDGTIDENKKQAFKTFLSSFSLNDSLNEKSPLSALAEYINKLYQDPNFTQEDLLEFLMGLDGNSDSLTAEDISKLSEYIAGDIMPNSVMEFGGAGDISGTQSSSGGSSGKTPFSPAMKDKNIENMSIDELKDELTNANSSAKTALVDLENTLKAKNEQLANNLSETTSNIEKTEADIAELETAISDNEAELAQAESDLGELSSQISSLTSKLSSCEDESQKAEIKRQIESLKEQKAKLENETIPSLNEQIEQDKEELEELNDTLDEYNKKFDEIQQEIAMLAQTDEEIKAKQEAYNEALEYIDAVSKKLETRERDFEKAQNADVPEIDERSIDYRDNLDYDFTNLPLSYTLDGKEYNCVGFPEYEINGETFQINSWEEAQRYLANGGVANIGKYGSMQCHNYSNVAGDLVTGTIDSRLLEAMYNETNDPSYGDVDMAGKMGSQHEYNSRDFAQCSAKDRDAERAIIENELQNGRPCLVSVPYTGGTHWVLAVGMSDDGDILIWDSYNGSMEKLGCSSNSDNEKLHRNMATGNGVMVFCNNYSYQYSKAKYIDYWEMITNPNYDPLIEGVK